MPDYDRCSDERLARRVREGDEGAFQALTDRYSEKLLARIKRRLRPGMSRKIAASDVLQEAHIVALLRIAEFEDRGRDSFGHWLGKIVEMKIREAVRRYAETDKRNVGREVSVSGAAGRALGGGPTPSQVVMGRELLAAAREAMEELTEDQQAALKLLQEERLTLDEAAARMERSPDAVKKVYGRALARLEELIGIRVRRRNERRRPTR